MSIIFTALFVAVATYIGAVLIFIKLPKRVKEQAVRHQLLTDTLATGAVYLTLSKISSSLVSATASALVGILISASLYLKNKQVKLREEQENLNGNDG